MVTDPPQTGPVHDPVYLFVAENIPNISVLKKKYVDSPGGSAGSKEPVG